MAVLKKESEGSGICTAPGDPCPVRNSPAGFTRRQRIFWSDLTPASAPGSGPEIFCVPAKPGCTYALMTICTAVGYFCMIAYTIGRDTQNRPPCSVRRMLTSSMCWRAARAVLSGQEQLCGTSGER